MRKRSHLDLESAGVRQFRRWCKEHPRDANDIGADEVVRRLDSIATILDQDGDIIEYLAAAGWRLMKLAGGADVAEGDIQFACADGTFSEQIAQCAIKGLRKRVAKLEHMEGNPT